MRDCNWKRGWKDAFRRLSAGALSAAVIFGVAPDAGLNAKSAGQARAADTETAAVFQSAKNYGGAATDALHDAAYTLDGGFVAMGYSFGENDDPAWTHTGSGNNNDAILLKFDREHKLQWSKAYGGDGVDIFNSIDVLKDGRIVALGRSAFTSEYMAVPADAKEGDTTEKPVISGVSWYLLMINPENPDDYTEYRIGGTGGDQGYGVAATSDGGFVAAGWSASVTGYMSYSENQTDYTEPVQLWEIYNGTDENIPNRIASGGSDSVVIKFNDKGEIEFTALHNYSVSENANNISTPSERLEAVAADSADNIYLVGYDAIAKNAQNAVIAKLDGADGHLIWHRSAGRANQTVVPEDAAEYIKAVYSGVAVLKDNSVVVTGTSTGDADTEENWKINGAKDTLIARYNSDGELLFSDNFGAIDDNDSRPEDITATPDGGYIICANQSGILYEDNLISKGYDWGNYGGEDAVLIKYDANNHVLWSENYGTKLGDWINAVIVREDGEIIAVGESNGLNGSPAWGNRGKYDGIILCTNLYQSAYTEPVRIVSDGNVMLSDGKYTAKGDGFGGSESVEVTIEIESGKISAVTGKNYRDTDDEPGKYYNAAIALHDIILEKQSANVDVISGATYSSNGIKDAAAKALGQSAAVYADDFIKTAAEAEEKDAKKAARSAADVYAELGTYAVKELKNLDILRDLAEQYEIELTSRADMAGEMEEIQPESGANLKHNDIYYKLQREYYQNIRADAFENAGLTGKGVKIAVIDSGLTLSHGDLDYNHILEGYDYDAQSAMGVDSLIDNDGHGTAVTGILSAVTDNEIGIAGLFSELEIIPLKLTPVSPAKDTEDGASSKIVAKAITDAADVYHADVITTSLDVKNTEELAQAVKYANSKNIIITGASGNGGNLNSLEDDYIYPASYDEVISVGAVDANNKIRANSQKNDKVFVVAPGENIAVLDLSRGGRCKLASGTSYASPIVAAMAVAAKEYNQDITPDEFKELLKTSSMDAGENGYDNAYGYGIVNFAAFVNALRGEDAPVFAGGDGSAESPWLIETPEQLAAISKNLSAHYQLNADIDLNNWTPIGEFVPMGEEGEEAELPKAENAFTGKFDGAGHKILNLIVNQPEGYALGLFGCTSGAEIDNLIVENASIDGCMMAGAVVGYAYNSTVSNITLTGDNKITGHNAELGSADMIGGIVGAGMDSILDSCTANADIIMPDNSSNAGILGGGLEVTSVLNGSASGSITAGDDCYGLGGVSGCGFGSENFTNCKAENIKITAGKNAYLIGGVTGYAGGYEDTQYGVTVTEIKDCAAKDIEITLGENYSGVGEIVGGGFYFDEYAEYGAPYDKPTVYHITDCEASNITVNGETMGNGPDDKITYTDGVYQGTAFGYLSDITVSVTIENGKIKSVESVSNRESPMFFQMASAVMASIVEQQTTAVDTVTGATYSSTGIINAVRQALERAANPNAEIYTTPRSDWFAGGSGTETDPFLIRTKENLMKLSATVDDVIDYKGYYVRLDADLDLSGANWRTIGGGVYAFNGVFDGAGHVISGLTLGTDDKPYTLDSSIRTIGLFGILGPDAVVKDLNLKDVQANVQSEGQIRLGALAGHANGSEENHGGAVINHCTVRGGYLKAETQDSGNSFVGGLTGYLTGGAIINSMTDVSAEATTKYWYAEAGGISGINNAGLVANCYALGTSTGNDGGGVDTDVAVSVLVGMQMGDLVNCYADGDIYANEPGYAGAVSGWVTDGRSYNSWYNINGVLELGGAKEAMKAYGAKDNPTMDYDGLYYINNMVRELNAYTASEKASVAESLNANFAAFPIDISVYGVGNQDLREWEYNSADDEIIFSDKTADVNYIMPEEENVPQVYQAMKDGVWYGRDADKTTVVCITTSDDKITETRVLQGQNSGDAYDAALKKAREKAIYGDMTDYNPVDTSSLQGSGTEAKPYLIATAADLRLIAEAINEDQSWEGVYFRQTADIDVSDEEWLPIGWAIQGYYRSRWTQFCEYPFKGNYDGGGFTVTGVHIGAPGQPTSDTRKAFTAGFFGVTRGTVNDNYAIQDDARLVTITDLHLRDTAIYSASHGNNYAGGLIAEPVNGFRIDKCSVEGTVSAAAETGVIYAGGLMGYALRGGLITNTWTNMEVSASSSRDSDGGNVYAGGLYGYDNRVTTVNAFTLGNVTGDGKENSVMVGGVSGANGGAHYNTYAMGDITARNATNYIGGLDGWLPDIGADYHGYYNSGAVQTVNGNPVESKKSVGVSSQAEDRDHTESKSKSQMQSADFVETLNANRIGISNELSPMQEAIGYHPLHTVYYTGDGSDLEQWTLTDGVVTMGDSALAPTIAPTVTPADAPAMTPTATPTPAGVPRTPQGCYIATAVYGSYDCPEVWTLRRFRDGVLAKTWYGRLFIRCYYTVSPTAVRLFGDADWFRNFWRGGLDQMVTDLQANGFESTPYQDPIW